MTNAGANIASAGKVITSNAEEMRAYDALGPLCRAALGRCVLPWSAVKVLAQHRKRGWNPLIPDLDAKLADELTMIDARAIANQHVNGQADNPQESANSPGERG